MHIYGWLLDEWGTRKQLGRRGEFVGVRSDLSQKDWPWRILKKVVSFSLALLSRRGYQPKVFILILVFPCSRVRFPVTNRAARLWIFSSF